MIKNAVMGDRVIVLDQYSKDKEPLTAGSSTIRQNINGKTVLLSKWDFSKSNTGTVNDVFKSGKGRHKIILISVIPDPPNRGIMEFKPKLLRRIK